MKCRNFILLMLLIFSCAMAMAEEINLEVDVSRIKPYDKFITGLGGTWRPEFLHHKRVSLGLGFIASVSNRFHYETTPVRPIPDDSGWMFYNDNHLEAVDFDFHLEGRWRLQGKNDQTKWKVWLTLNLGDVVNLATISQYQTRYLDVDHVVLRGPFAYKSPTRFDPYFSPGILIGIGNFTLGYRHWFYFDHLSIQPGEAGRPWGSLRLGYRFQW